MIEIRANLPNQRHPRSITKANF